MQFVFGKKFVGVVLKVNSHRGNFLAIGVGSKAAAMRKVGA